MMMTRTRVASLAVLPGRTLRVASLPDYHLEVPVDHGGSQDLRIRGRCARGPNRRGLIPLLVTIGLPFPTVPP